MKIEGTYLFDAPREIVWETLMDPESLAKALPGGEKLVQVGDNQYEATLNVRVGPVQGKFDGEIELADINEPNSYHMKVTGQGPAGFLNGKGAVSLSDSDDGTLMNYSGEAQVGGKISGVGQRLVDSSAKSITRQGLEAIDKLIQARVAGEDIETAAAAAAPSTAAVAATVARDVTTDAFGDMMGQLRSNEGIGKVLSPEMLPYTLGVGAIILTLIFAGLARLIAG